MFYIFILSEILLLAFNTAYKLNIIYIMLISLILFTSPETRCLFLHVLVNYCEEYYTVSLIMHRDYKYVILSISQCISLYALAMRT